MEKKLRRMESNLVISGTGLITFMVWEFIRVLMIVYSYKDEVMELLRQDENYDWEDMSLPVMLLLFGLILIVIALPYLYVAKCARDEGRRKKSRRVYIVIAIILLIPQAISAIYSVVDVFMSDDIFVSAVTATIDITVLAVLAETVTTAIRVKKYRKELGMV